MSKQEQMPPQLEALKELEKSVTSPEDEATLAGWNEEIQRERADTLSSINRPEESVSRIAIDGAGVVLAPGESRTDEENHRRA